MHKICKQTNSQIIGHAFEYFFVPFLPILRNLSLQALELERLGKTTLVRISRQVLEKKSKID